jgi:hypothetical protein
VGWRTWLERLVLVSSVCYTPYKCINPTISLKIALRAENMTGWCSSRWFTKFDDKESMSESILIFFNIVHWLLLTSDLSVLDANRAK